MAKIINDGYEAIRFQDRSKQTGENNIKDGYETEKEFFQVIIKMLLYELTGVKLRKIDLIEDQKIFFYSDFYYKTNFCGSANAKVSNNGFDLIIGKGDRQYQIEIANDDRNYYKPPLIFRIRGPKWKALIAKSSENVRIAYLHWFRNLDERYFLLQEDLNSENKKGNVSVGTERGWQEGSLLMIPNIQQYLFDFVNIQDMISFLKND